METHKTCRLCGIAKPISEYRFRKDSGKYRNECKECCNKRSAEYRRTHKERVAELNRKYRELHKEELAEYSKEYQKNHLAQFREYNKKYRGNLTDEQKDLQREREKRYREKWKENPEYVERRRAWNRESTKRRRKKITAYEEERKKNDPVFKLKKQIRSEIRASFNRRGFKKSDHTEEIVGCSLDYLYRYLCMTYLIRYGDEYDGTTEVHIDHIKPLSNARTEDEVIRLCRYDNLQLLKAEDNLRKNDDEAYLPRIEDLIEGQSNNPLSIETA